MQTSVDAFLGGRLLVEQPLTGYRAATDPVLLAASVQAEAGQSVLDVGCGVGVASLCLGARISGLHLTGLEIQADYAALARDNAVRNAVALQVVESDLQNNPLAVQGAQFDHVITNPPFFEFDAITPPKDLGKDTAHRARMDLGQWIALCLKRLAPKGWFSIIHRAEFLPDILRSLDGPTGDIRVKPITPRAGRPANRVIVQARKGSKGSFTLLSSFVMHNGAAHAQDGDDYSAEAGLILRNAHELLMS